MNILRRESTTVARTIRVAASLGMAIWLIVLVGMAATVGFFSLGLIIPGIGLQRLLHWLPGVALAVMVMVVGTALIWRRLSALFSHRSWRGYLWATLVIASGVVLYYSVEGWCGRRAWRQLASELKAGGATLDIESLMPAEVPATENFAQAPLFVPLFECTARPNGELVWRDPAAAEAYSKLKTIGEFESAAVNAVRYELMGDWALGEFADLARWQALYKKRDRFRVLARGYDGVFWLRPMLPYPRGRNDMQSKEAARKIQEALRPYDDAIHQVRTASERPYARFPRQSEQGFFTRELHLSLLKQIQVVLRMRAAVALTLGDAAGALADSQALFRLAALVRQQPVQLGYTRWNQMLVDNLQPVWEGLAGRCWSESQIEALQHQLETLDVLADFGPALRTDILFQIDFINQIVPLNPARTPDQFDTQSDPAGRWLLALARRVYPHGWIYQDEVGMYRFYQKRAVLVDTVRRRVFPEPTRPADYLVSLDPLYAIFLAPRIEYLGSALLESCAYTQTAVNQAVVACALERYRLAHQQYPTDLSALVPRFLTRLPADIIDGQSLRYLRPVPDQFTLYSVGWDGTDDGGRIKVQQHSHGRALESGHGDWVWQYPTLDPK